jgi:hypothetical protein
VFKDILFGIIPLFEIFQIVNKKRKRDIERIIERERERERQ